MTLKIYGVLRSRATRNVWLLREMGAPFERVPVKQAGGLADPLAPDAPLNTASPAFLRLNPNGLIPFMDDDGFQLGESLAINLYAAKKFGGPFAPDGAREEALATMWSLWAAANCEPPGVQIMMHRGRLPPEQRDEKVVAAAGASLARPLRGLEARLREADFVIGARFTVADVNVAEVLRYAQFAPESLAPFPAVGKWLAACQARPVFRQMMAEREAEPA